MNQILYFMDNRTSNGQNGLPVNTRNFNEAGNAVSQATSRGTVLVVEDYAPNIMVISMLLENLGFEVIATETGEKAIEIIEGRSEPFTTIFMDVQMHGMDGFETTRRIRALEKEKHFRQNIIGVTAHALAGDRERCLSAGMDDYISKPIHPDILAARLEQVEATVCKAFP